MVPEAPGAHDPSLRSASSSPVSRVTSKQSARHPIRRQSTQERLDAILHTARQRAESLNAARTATGTGAARTRSVPMEPLLRNQSAPGTFAGGISEHESSADETTGIVSAPRVRGHGSGRGGPPNYLSTATTATPPSTAPSGADGGLRSRTQKTAAAAAAAARGGRASSGRSSSETAPAATAAAAAAPAVPWWKSALAGVRSLELENKGSVARDHLALERTFLAWLRTSLSFASIGIAVTQLFRLNVARKDADGAGDGSDDNTTLRHLGRPLGITFLAISILVLGLGYHRYYQSQQWIVRGKFPASRFTILLLSLVAFSLMVASLVVVVVVRPAQ